MAKTIGDRYTQFFTPDEFKQFNDALDPERISGIGVMIEARSRFQGHPPLVRGSGNAGRPPGLRPGDVMTAIGADFHQRPDRRRRQQTVARQGRHGGRGVDSENGRCGSDLYDQA